MLQLCSRCFNRRLPLTKIFPHGDVSNVTEMTSMFYLAQAFNNGDSGNNGAKPLTSWDTSNVTTMSWMFYRASVFNQDISNFDTSNVIDMSYMFHYAQVFNQDIFLVGRQ